jgi:transketolase
MHDVDMELVTKLENKAVEIRKKLLTMCQRVGVAHLGGTLSLCDMAVALYYEFLKFDPKNPNWEERDRLILSKGHTGCLIYNIFADMGIYKWEEIYNEYNKIDGRFGMHPNRKYIPNFEASTGSLGHGLSLATGMALAGRADKSSCRVICITGDGELDEGSNWEAIMCAAHYKLGNLVAIVDRNNISSSGPTETVMSLEPLPDKWRSFGWDVIIIDDGNDMKQIVEALLSLPPVDSVTPRKPICIISNTVKGKGVDFMENDAAWHIVYGLTDEKLCNAIECVDKNRKVRS